jgi:hypothetical protein
MSNSVDVSGYTEGIRITITEARVITDTNSSVFLFMVILVAGYILTSDCL